MEPLRTKLERIAAAHGLREVYVFGSRADEITTRIRGSGLPGTGRDGTERSDVDIAVQPIEGRNLDVHQKVALTLDLESLFGVDRVDLIVLSEAPLFLALEIIRGELLLTRDPDAQAEQELYILRRAGDLAPFQAERIRQVLTEGAR